MIANRLSRLATSRNWSAVGVEFFVVVFGILLALGVDEWRNDKNARAEEYEILVALNKDITASIGQVEYALGEIDLITDGLRFLAAGSEDHTDRIDSKELDFHIANGLWETGVYAPEMNTYSELLNSGKLAVIDSVDIRRRLANYERSLQLSLALFRDVFEHQQNKLDSYLIDSVRLPQVFEAQIARRHDRNYSLPLAATTIRDHTHLLENDLFQNHVAAKFFLIAEYERYTKDVRTVLIELQELVISRIEFLEI
jgi:hypothetical protein